MDYVNLQGGERWKFSDFSLLWFVVNGTQSNSRGTNVTLVSDFATGRNLEVQAAGQNVDDDDGVILSRVSDTSFRIHSYDDGALVAIHGFY